MTNRDSHIIFKVLLDKNAEGIAYGGCPAFLEEEVDIFLNQAQLEVLSNKVTGNNALRVGFEGSPSNVSEIDKLVKTDDNLHAVKTEFNEFVLSDLHDEGRRMTILHITLKMGQYQTNCNIVDHTVVKPYKWTYNNVPWVEMPMATIEDDSMLIYVDPILMQEDRYAPRIEDNTQYYRVDLTYIAKPKEFDYTRPDVELDFPEDVMNEIINRAVVLALENIESQRSQTKLQLNQVQE